MVRVLPFVLLLLTATAVRADSLASVQTARALLGPDVWSRVLRIDNQYGTSRYPAQLHALVFALEGRLWIYTEFDGTQSLSIYADRLEQDKADLAPLLREISPALRGFTDLTDSLPMRRLSRAQEAEMLPSGCFIKCIARLRALQSGVSPPDNVGLLAYYVVTLAGRLGHTVLVYRQDGRRYVYDPEGEGTVHLLPEWQSEDPLKLARAVYPLGYRQPPDQAKILALREMIGGSDRTLVADRARAGSDAGSSDVTSGLSLY